MTAHVRQLDHLNLTVTDLDTTEAFYARLFGFERVENGLRNGHRWSILKSGEALLCLYERPDRRVLDDTEGGKLGLHTLNHIGLRIDDREAWERTVAEEGVVFSYPSPVEWAHSVAWYLLDPSGHEVEVAWWREGRATFR